MRIAITAFMLVVWAGLGHASALDPTFDGDGALDARFPGSAFDIGTAVGIDPNGSIVTTGISNTATGFAILRVLTDGTPDPGFGTGGFVDVPLPGTPGIAQPTSLVIDPDGSIVVAGFPPGMNGVVMVRCTPGGTLDPTFGTGGVVTTLGLFDPRDLVRDSAGGYFLTAGGKLAHYDSLGALDPGFGTGGIRSLPLGATGIALQPDGKILVAGSIGVFGADSDVAIARYDAAGSADAAFGVNGIVTTSVGPSFDSASAIALTSDGRIVVGGYTYVAQNVWHDLLVRYLANGSLDTSFGTGGIVVTDMGGISEIRAMAIVPDDRLVVAGVVNPVYPFQLGFPLVRRHLVDGSLDPTFPIPGNGTFGESGFNDVTLQPDGKIVVTGSRKVTTPTLGYRFHLRRYLSEGFCGNTIVDPGEDCDDPEVGSCCNADCTFTTAGASCPSDGEPCTADTCDGAGTCTHTTVPDIPITSCDDGNACSVGDHCVAGTCTPTTVFEYGTLCTLCDPATGLGVARPRTDCKTTLAPHASSLKIKFDASGNERHRVAWQWRKGEATSFADLGDALTGGLDAFHDFCVFDESGPTPALELATGVGTNVTETCATGPCWRTHDQSLVFKRNPPSLLGVSKMTLRAGSDGRARQSVQGKGPALFAPNLPFIPTPPPYALPLRAQLWSRDGTCWEATYSPAGVRSNGARSFQAKSN